VEIDAMFWTLVAIAGALIALVIGIYNTLVQRRNRYRNAFAQIDVQFRRRHDLIPNLVEVAQAYLKHERETLEAVTAARGAAIAGLQAAARNPGDATAMRDLGAAEQGLSGALGRLLAVSETYPDLKANTTMMQLSEELTSTENKVAFARQAFNDAVMHYNTLRESFPANLIAARYGFLAAELLEIGEPAARQAPRISLG
jgi:LemA protein